MPTITKSKTHSKCRAWEQERRKRLGVAFSNLAAALPSQQSSAASTATATSPPNTKILILQHSLQYIQDLQAAKQNNTKGDVVDVAIETDKISDDEVAVLKAKCWELVKILVEARIPLPTPPPTIISPADKYIIQTDTTKKTEDNNETLNAAVEDDDMEPDAGESCDDDDASKKAKKSKKKEVEGKRKKNVKKKPTINRKHTRKKGGSLGAATIHNANSVWVTNGALRGSVVLPLLPHLLPPAPPTILINPFPFPLLTAPRKFVDGFDITRTTMVNKVPIPTTTLSMAQKKTNGKSLKQLPKVTYQSKLKVLKALKAKKEENKNKKSDAADKPTEQTTQDNNKDVVKSTPQAVANSKSGTGNQSNASNKSNVNKKLDTSTAEVSKTDPKLASLNNKEDTLVVKQNAVQVNQVETNKGSATDGNRLKVNNVAATVQSTEPTVSSQSKSVLASSIEIIKGNNSNMLMMSNKVPEDNGNVSSDCIKESSCSKRRKLEENERQEIGGDMGEELSLPSPTAAFLLTFPLVCPGPSEPMQPPQDHFSNYFSRDTSIPQTNAFLPNDLPVTKSSGLVADVTKTNSTWPLTPNIAACNNSKMTNDTRLLVMPDRNVSCTKDTSKDIPPSSSACVFSGAQNMFPSVCNNNYPFSESIFNYEHAPVGGNIKGIGKTSYSQNNKVSFNFDNLHWDNKQLTGDSSVYSSTIPHTIINNDAGSSSFGYNKDNNNTGYAKKTYDNNSYNPITTTTFGGSSNNNLRSKSSNMYFPDLTSNIYTQSCNLWMDDNNAYGGEYIKSDSAKKSSNTMQNNPSSSVVLMDTQPDFRYPISMSSKNSNVSKNTDSSLLNKNVKVTGKISVKDSKYLVQDIKDAKSEYSTQKGPINWMTSEVNFGQNNQDIFPNSNQKDVRNNNMLQGSNQCVTLDTSSLPIAGLSTSMCNKKTELYDQPFYMPSGGFVPQTVNDDNQFTWSPSKLMPLAESTPLVPCSLPTLVGDLSLSMGDTKQAYQHLFLEQPDNNTIIKSNDKKNHQQKNKTPVKNNKVDCEMNGNNANAGNFLSVSQIMDRGKEENMYQDNVALTKANQNRNINKHNIGDTMPEVFGVQQMMTEYFPKATQKNTYSTESLLQSNDNHFVSSGSSSNAKSKNINKSYQASNLCISSNINNSNQHNNGNNQMEFENFSHTNLSNSYCYPGTVNTPLYTTCNYLPATASNVSSYSCINSGYMPDGNDYTTNMDNNLYTKMDPCSSLDIPKYNFDTQHKSANVSSKHHKVENLKKEAVMKRQKKNKAVGNESYVMGVGGQRCYPGGDDAVYGYQMSMSTYPTSHKAAGSHVKAAPGSPNHSGTSSLANFNLSTIFPEINKRPAMPGYPDSSHKPSMSLYL